jgi:hypothetical protein
MFRVGSALEWVGEALPTQVRKGRSSKGHFVTDWPRESVMSSKSLGVLLLTVGVLLFLVGLMADPLGIGPNPGIGYKQIALAFVGVCLAAVGMVKLRR